MKIKLLLVDDHKIMRDGLKSILEKFSDIGVAGEAGNAEGALKLALENKFDLIIMDISMPGMSGIEATGRILSEIPGQKILALSMHEDRGFLIRMLKAGAAGYILKECASDELIYAIRAVMKDVLYISPSLIDDMVRDYINMDTSRDLSVFSILTKREREVLQGLSEGKSIKEIAYSLQVSVKTIETFRYKIEKKLNLHSIAELTKYAIREGITSL